jgi:phosphate transport system substrate-binding protein
MVGISRDSDSEAFKPYQAYIKTKEYAFTRSVYMINRQTRAGLGMGFVSFVAGDKGQLIILKSGLIPSIAPVRLVEVNMNSQGF